MMVIIILSHARMVLCRDRHRERKKILKSRYKATIVGGQEGCPEAEENTIFPTENEISRLFNP